MNIKRLRDYNCQKAIGKLTDSSTFTVYFTKDLVLLIKIFNT